MKRKRSDINREKPLDELSATDRDAIIKSHLTSKAKCRDYLQRLKINDKKNVNRAIKRMQSLCNRNKYELCIYIYQEYRAMLPEYRSDQAQFYHKLFEKVGIKRAIFITNRSFKKTK